MLTLSIECSTPQGSIAITKDNQLVGLTKWATQNTHGESVIPSIRACLNQIPTELRKIDLIAVDHGPGRFTGVRVGINAAKTIAYTLQKSVFSISSLDIMAEPARVQELPILCLVNAHKNLFFTSLYEKKLGLWNKTLVECALPIESIISKLTKPTICLGDGYELLKEKNLDLSLLVRDSSLSDYPQAEVLAKIAFDQKGSGQTLDWRSLNPLYIRASEAEEKLGVFT